MSGEKETSYRGLVQRTILQYGVAKMAAELDMRETTLYAKANPNYRPDRNHKLAMTEWDTVLRTTGDYDSLKQFAYEHGFMITEIPEIDDGGLGPEEFLGNVARLAKEHAEAMAALLDVGQPGNKGGRCLSISELPRCIKELRESVAVSTYLLRLLQAQLNENL